MAVKAVDAANAQHTVLPTQSTGSALVVRLAEQINSMDAEILLSMPGFGPVPGATFLANTGGDRSAFETVEPKSFRHLSRRT